ncbi:MAG: TIGR00159 family protein, partial [Persephonella sp.]
MFEFNLIFSELILSIRWNDILDIFIVAVIIYYLLKFL